MATKALKIEVQTDPLSRGYSTMSDQEVADSLNNTTLGATRNKTVMTGSEVLQEIVEADFNALSAAQQQEVWNVLHLGNLGPFGIESTILTRIFVAGSATILALAAARVEAISRAAELGVTADAGSVSRAR